MPRKTVLLSAEGCIIHGEASMRPRPDAAENARWCMSIFTKCSSFNEAAARCRGKPTKSPAASPVRLGLQ